MSIVIETKQGGRIAKEHLPVGDAELADALSKLDGDRTTLFSITIFRQSLVCRRGRREVYGQYLDGRR
jgi:hypothetical protein